MKKKNILNLFVVFMLVFSFVFPANLVTLATKVNAEETVTTVEATPAEEPGVIVAEETVEETTEEVSEVKEDALIALPTSPSFEITMEVLTAQPVLTGDQITWEIRWRCASITDPCLDAKINVTKPAGMSFNQAGAEIAGGESATSDSEYIATATADGTHAEFIFDPILPAGTAGTAKVTFTSDFSHEGMIANGTIFTPVATGTASNTPSVIASAGATVASTLELEILKTRVPNDTALNPALDQNVDYMIQFRDPRTNCSAGPMPLGAAASRNVVITDTLPAGAIFVSANNGGVYNAGTNTVTWPAIDYVGYNSGCYGWFYQPLLMKVKYPSPTFSLASTVTNEVEITGEMTNQPTTTTSDASSVSHGFAVATNAGQFSKTCTGGVDPCFVVLDRDTNYDLNISNTGNTPVDFIAKDALPCPQTSPSFGSPCANPGFQVSGFGIWNPTLATPVVVNYTTNLGNTGSITMTNYYTTYAVPSPHAGPTEFIKDFTVVGKLDGGEQLRINVMGKIPSTYSFANQVNTASVIFDFGRGGIQNFTDTDTMIIDAPRPNIYNFKYTVSGEVVAPGQETTFGYNFLNDGEIGVNPVLTDLLPLGYEYVSGSATSNIPGLLPATVITNFNGTGRDLVRFTWPLATKIGPDETTYNTLTFKALVKEGATPSTGVNEMQVGAPDHVLNVGCVYGSIVDANDLDGDGSTTDYLCNAGSNAPYTITTVAGIVIDKEVKGDLDGTFMLPPSIGHSTVGGNGEYKITVRNYGNVPLTNTVVYDILPFIGDHGVSGSELSNPRNSEFQIDIAGPLTGADLAGATVQYSMSDNPCRGEVIAIGAPFDRPLGCDARWTNTFSVGARALRVVFTDTLEVGGMKTFIVPFKVSGSATLNQKAWNSVAFNTTPSSNIQLLPTEAQVAGLEVSPVRNIPPVANANVDQTITLPTTSTTLDGSLSTDPDGTIVSYVWTFVSGPGAIDPDDVVSPNISSLVVGTYVFQLKVTDNNGAMSTDNVTIVVQNRNSGGGGGGSSSGSRPKGKVLGAATDICSAVDTYMRVGHRNDSVQVKILQGFLNDYMQSGLVVDGNYGPKTADAVGKFQIRQAKNILDPWGLTGPTYIFYKTSLAEAKRIMCPDQFGNLPIPGDLINWSKNPTQVPARVR